MLFAKPLLSDGSYIVAYLTVLANHMACMLQFLRFQCNVTETVAVLLVSSESPVTCNFNLI
jgi:hypothetical protein